eukprot:8969661-Pyramimonas_sp.AAC.1
MDGAPVGASRDVRPAASAAEGVRTALNTWPVARSRGACSPVFCQSSLFRGRRRWTTSCCWREVPPPQRGSRKSETGPSASTPCIGATTTDAAATCR